MHPRSACGSFNGFQQPGSNLTSMEFDHSVHGLGRLLGAVALVFVGIFLVGVGGDAFPLALLDPPWQLRMSSAINSNGGFLLTGFALLFVAAALLPQSLRLQNALRRARSWAALVSLCFFLLVPLQVVILWRFDSLSASTTSRQQATFEQRLADLRRQVGSARNNGQIQASLGAFGAPPLSPVELGLPTPELQRRVLVALSATDAELKRRAAVVRNQARRPELVRGSIRTMLLSLLFALGFAAGAVLPGSRRTLLEEILGLLRAPLRLWQLATSEVASSLEDMQERRQAAQARRIRERLHVHRQQEVAGIHDPQDQEPIQAKPRNKPGQGWRVGIGKGKAPLPDEDYIRLISDDQDEQP